MLNLTSIDSTFTEYLLCARYHINLPHFHRSWKFCLRVFCRKKISFTFFLPALSLLQLQSSLLPSLLWYMVFLLVLNGPNPGPSNSLKLHPKLSSPALSPLTSSYTSHSLRCYFFQEAFHDCTAPRLGWVSSLLPQHPVCPNFSVPLVCLLSAPKGKNRPV